MRIAEQLYFAPEVRFADLDWTGARLPTQFQQRISGFYLKPALILARSNHAFAAGVLVVCAIDALALLSTGLNAVSGRITAFCKARIPDLADGYAAKIFCESFRNGLVHEARVKNGSEFCLGLDRIAYRQHDRLTVNPQLLASHMLGVLHKYVQDLHHGRADKAVFQKKLKKMFRYELEH